MGHADSTVQPALQCPLGRQTQTLLLSSPISRRNIAGSADREPVSVLPRGQAHVGAHPANPSANQCPRLTKHRPFAMLLFVCSFPASHCVPLVTKTTNEHAGSGQYFRRTTSPNFSRTSAEASAFTMPNPPGWTSPAQWSFTTKKGLLYLRDESVS